MTGCTSSFDIQFVLCKHVLGCSDDMCMGILEQTLQQMQKVGSTTETILHVDEAQECLDDGDREDFRKQQQKAKEDQVETEHFGKHFKARYTEQKGGAAALNNNRSGPVHWQEEDGAGIAVSSEHAS